jgi:hypothetical protein
MAISRAFAYNTGAAIPGLTQVGNLAISGTSFSGLTSSLSWYNGPDESLGYVIAYESSGNTVPGGASPLTISTNAGSGLNGFSVGGQAVAFDITANPAIGTTYPIGSQITFQNGEVRTFVGYDDYGSIYDIFYDSPISTSTLFPITIQYGTLARVQFWRSSTQSDATFISLSQYISNRHGSPQTFSGATQAVSWLNSNGYWTSYAVSSTLGTLANPAVSAQAIYNSGQTTSGWYYIQTSNMTSAKQIYCNMTDEGGGWMLMSYSPNNIAAPLGIPYPNQWLGGTGSLTSRVSIDAREVWYHNGLAQCSQVMKMASTTASLVPLLNNVVIANRVVYSNPNNLRLSATFSTTLNNNTPMTGTWSGIKGHTLMNTSLAVNAPGDWIYSVNTWWTVCGPSTQLLSDGRSGNAQGSGSWTNISNGVIYGMADVNTITTSSRSDIKTYAVYIK